ncbi:helix-turn-helix domain-containing protein [Glaciimonas sp. PAMC28666]|uniref:helix-turn-helix domain-containing protein n=1 Tax=Glaciimonas sp. PAMC28666 TaxID=2807626 RepID=UPI0019667262|nr:helix-turn-helix domain-containing protein [Glaciimonas sp. PAMC28666]QRX82232.1 helix-turn-helix domain-containing protein [Glaciimonas sp. PAMC28666]
MSVEAITWALNLKVERSTAKFVLVAMANCANNDMVCWPSVQYLSAATCQDRKTVQENIRRLKQAGFIAATDVRKGRTGQVIVYQLKNPENGPVKEAQKRDVNDPNRPGNGPVDEPYSGNDPENGPVKEAQKREGIGLNTPENGPLQALNAENERGPFFPSNRPVFSLQRGPFFPRNRPKNGPRNRKEP